MTIEQSHGRDRLTPPRLTDMGTSGASPQQPAERADQLRQNAMYRGSKEAARASLAAVVGTQVRRAIPSDAAPEESRLVAANALQLASDAAREINVASPYVAHHVTRFGTNAALAGFFTQKAAEAGFDSPRGLELIEAAHRCEGAATRAMVAAAAAVRTFSQGRRREPKVIDMLEARAAEHLAAAESGGES
jgi:hypothetical protein